MLFVKSTRYKECKDTLDLLILVIIIPVLQSIVSC